MRPPRIRLPDPEPGTPRTVRAILRGRPIAHARATRNRAGTYLTPATYRAWRDAQVGDVIRAARPGGRPMHCPVTLDLVVHPDGLVITLTPTDGGATTLDAYRSGLTTGDLDNYIKAALDLVQTPSEKSGVKVGGAAILDDNQVVAITARFSPRPIDQEVSK